MVLLKGVFFNSMKRSHFLIIFLFPFFINCSSGSINEKKSIITNGDSILVDYCQKFNQLNTEIRDGKLKFSDASKQFKFLISEIKKQYLITNQSKFSKSDWVFPVQAYSKSSIGGSNGNGYLPGNYNYFDGNKHTGHPAQDIFAMDKNQDCLDDNSKTAINILSISSGVVIASEPIWDSNSQIRGGKYILIYDPENEILFYYAHNNKINVKIGDIVEPGMIIANMGRTGLNAFKKRSPTHLHLMCLKIKNDLLPEPINIYEDLVKMKSK